MPDRSVDHNVAREPQVPSVFPANPTGIFGNRARETDSLLSHTETGSVAGLPARRGVNLFGQTDDRYELPLNENDYEDDDDEDDSEDENENDDEDEDDEGDEKESEDEGEEESVADDLSSPDPIDDRALQNSLNTVKLKLQGLTREIYSYQLARDPETRLHQIYEETKKLSGFKDQETRIVGFIGETGAGLCFLIFILTWTGLIVEQARAPSSTQYWTREAWLARYEFQVLYHDDYFSDTFILEWSGSRMYLCAYGVSICG